VAAMSVVMWLEEGVVVVIGGCRACRGEMRDEDVESRGNASMANGRLACESHQTHSSGIKGRRWSFAPSHMWGNQFAYCGRNTRSIILNTTCDIYFMSLLPHNLIKLLTLRGDLR
jgi:hypothetical protein